MINTIEETDARHHDSPEVILWQNVIFTALKDALCDGDLHPKEKREAHAWITRGGSDYQTVCDLAGMDPNFVRDAYRAGKIDGQALQNWEKWLEGRAAQRLAAE